MMDFIDRLIAKNSEGGLPDGVKSRPRTRFETADSMVGIESSQEVVYSPELPTPTLSIPSSNETRYTKSQIQTTALVPSFEQKASTGLPSQYKLSSEEQIRMDTETLSTTVIEPLIQPSNSTSEAVPGLSIRIEPSGEQNKKKRLESLSPPETRTELLTLIERMEEPERLPLMGSDEKPILPRVEKRPVVKVAIGRIEVHTPPPLVQPKTASRRPVASIQPVRSLDDYLHRRNGHKS